MHGIGGSYEIRGGKVVQLEAPTRSHPDGDRARPAASAEDKEPKKTKTGGRRAVSKE